MFSTQLSSLGLRPPWRNFTYRPERVLLATTTKPWKIYSRWVKETEVPFLQHPTEEQEARILAELGMTKAGVEQDKALLRDWLRKQPHLPEDDVDDLALERLLIRCKNSVVNVQRRLDDMYTIRSAMPEFYNMRDPLTPDIRQLFKVMCFFALPRLTPDLQRVSIVRLVDPDVARFNLDTFVKVSFMCQEIVLREPATLGDIVIWDARNYTLAHAATANPILIRKAIVHTLKTYPARVTGIHVLFPPPFADRILNIIKSFLPEKIANRIHMHCELATLSEHIPKYILPNDYGGEERSSEELSGIWESKFVSYRSYFLHTEIVKADETRRPGKAKFSTQTQYLDIEGAFRKLNID